MGSLLQLAQFKCLNLSSLVLLKGVDGKHAGPVHGGVVVFISVDGIPIVVIICSVVGEVGESLVVCTAGIVDVGELGESLVLCTAGMVVVLKTVVEDSVLVICVVCGKTVCR